SHTLTLEVQSALESCLDCGACGMACAWYLETGDRDLHPKRRRDFLRRVYRRCMTVEGRSLGALGVYKGPTEAELREQQEAFWKCSCCGRCTMACPLSLSNRAVFRWARNAYAECGMSAENPVRGGIIEATRSGAHSFGVARERLLLLLGGIFSARRTEVPVDVQGADYLIVFPTVDTLRFPDQLWKLFRLLNAGRVRYTTSSCVFDLGTEIDHVVVDHGLSRRMLENVEHEVRRLAAGTLIIPECGCDVRTFYVDASQILGRPLSIRVESVDIILHRLLSAGQLPVRPIAARIALHDPCQVTRLSGLGQLARNILEVVAPAYREMTPNRDENYCCNGSSGPLRLPENAELRRRVSRLKAEQIRRTGANRVVTPCAVCTLSLTDICQTYRLDPAGQHMVSILYEVVFEAMQAALCHTGQESRAEVPALLEGRPRTYWNEHSLGGLYANLFRRKENAGHLRWALEHEAVKGRFEEQMDETPTPLSVPHDSPEGLGV
ncbi:MAG TPA: (Fe-S)-binding protein, partial [Polyangia bacterium]